MNDSATTTISPRTVFRFLFFSREAIIDVASSKSACWIGLFFVIAAGLAREYDGEYLIAEPWHLFLPLAASLIGCAAMVLVIYMFLKSNGEEENSLFEIFRSFLSVYWMTAPLAFVYGLPVERFLDPGDATRANLCLLAIVAVWRVALMMRCVFVLCGTSVWRSVVIVLLFSDVLAMLALFYVPGPIFMIMGGVRLTESEQIILSVRMFLSLLCYGTILIWVIGFVSICIRRRSTSFYRSNEQHIASAPSVNGLLWLIALASIAFWIPLLFITQPEQQLRWKSERLLEAGKFAEFGQFVADNPNANFPPHWDPPPRVGYGDFSPRAFLVLHDLLKTGSPMWLIEAYQEKFEFEISTLGWHAYHADSSRSLSDNELEKLVHVLEQTENGSELAKKIYWSGGDRIEGLSLRRTELLNRVEVIAGVNKN